MSGICSRWTRCWGRSRPAVNLDLKRVLAFGAGNFQLRFVANLESKRRIAFWAAAREF
jgi:hypothetical protein